MKIIVLEWNKVIATIKIENGINPINKKNRRCLLILLCCSIINTIEQIIVYGICI